MLYERDYMKRDKPEPLHSGTGFNMNQKILIFLIAAFFLQRLFLSFDVFIPSEIFGLNPTSVIEDFQIWRLLTYMVIHDNLFQLIFVGLGIFFFGRFVENSFGSTRYLYFFLLAGLFAGLIYAPSAYLGRASNATFYGATSAVMGILVVTALKQPNKSVFLIVIPMKMKHMVLLFVGMDLFKLLSQQELSLAIALPRLAGAGFGYLFLRYHKRVETFIQNLEPDKKTSSNNPQVKPPSRRNRQNKNGITDSSTDVREQEIDRILDKINREGFHNLTSKERGILEQASEDLKDDES